MKRSNQPHRFTPTRDPYPWLDGALRRQARAFDQPLDPDWDKPHQEAPIALSDGTNIVTPYHCPFEPED